MGEPRGQSDTKGSSRDISGGSEEAFCSGAVVDLLSETGKVENMMNVRIAAPRYTVAGMSIVYDTGEDFWAGSVVDASETGLFIETAHELDPGTVVTILPGIEGDEDLSELLPFELKARVVRVNEYDMDEHWDRTPGIAFIWTGMSEDERTLFRRFLEKYGVLVRR